MTFCIVCSLVKSTQNIWVILQNRTGRFVHSVMNSSSGGQRVGKEVVVPTFAGNHTQGRVCQKQCYGDKQEYPKVPTPTPFRFKSTCHNILEFSDFILET